MENRKREELIKSILEGARKNPDFREFLIKRAEQALKKNVKND